VEGFEIIKLLNDRYCVAFAYFHTIFCDIQLLYTVSHHN
jgi:hypothetical protein